MYTAATLLIIGLYAASISVSFRRGEASLRFGVALGVFYFVAIPYLILAVAGTLPDPSNLIGRRVSAVEVGRDDGYLFPIMFMVVIYWVIDSLIVKLWRPLRLISRSRKNGPSKERSGISSPQLVLAVVSLEVTLFLAMGIGMGHWADTRSEFLITHGLVGSTIVSSVIGLRLVALVRCVADYIQGRLSFLRLMFLLGVLCGINLFASGNRMFTLQAIALVVVVLVARGEYRKLWTTAVVMAPVGLVLATSWTLFRIRMHSWESYSLAAIRRAVEDALAFTSQYAPQGVGLGGLLRGATESQSVNYAVALVSMFPERYDYLWGSTLLKPFVLWIPRSWWPGKPVGIAQFMGDAIYPGHGTSLGVSTFGEFYANFGVAGVFLMPVFFFGLWRVMKSLVGSELDRGLLLLTAGFTLVRMSFSSVFLGFLFAGLFLWVLERLISRETSLLSAPVGPRLAGH